MLFRKCAASAAGVSFFVAATLSTLVLPNTAKAVLPPGAFTITIAPDGAGNVVASGSGDVNIGGGIASGNDITNAFMNPTGPYIFNGPASPINTTLNTYAFPGSSTPITGPTSFGTAGETDPTSGTGSMFGFAYFTSVPQIDLYVPSGYTSDIAFTDTSTYTGATLASLGLTPNTYIWTTGSGNTMNTITIIVSGTPTPEPASLSLLGLGGTMLLRRRRKA